MREPTYFILLSLLEGRLHGYGIAKRASELSNGRVSLAVGTLYGALDRLVDQGHITVDGKEKVQGRTRRYYLLTDDGRRALLGEVARLRSSLEAANNSGLSVGGASGKANGGVAGAPA